MIASAVRSFAIWTVSIVMLFAAICESELVLVQMICRHGDRTPEWLPPDENHSWSIRAGHLTHRGMLQAVQIGEFLRQRYFENLSFLKRKYDPVDARFFSTSTDRTRQTALIVGATMYGGQTLAGKLNFYPVPYTTHEFDIGLNWTTECPAYGTYLTTTYSKNFSPNFTDIHHGVVELMKRRFNTSVSLLNSYRIYDTLLIEQIHGQRRPWVNDTIMKALKDITKASLDYLIAREQKSALRFAPGFKFVFNNFERKIEGSLASKFLFYAAHDATLHGWMYWLGRPLNDLVGYVSFLLIELHSVGETEDMIYGVKILLYPGTHHQRVNVRLRDVTKEICQSDLCSLEHLERLLSPLLTLDYKAACNGSARQRRLFVPVYIIFVLACLLEMLR